MSSVLVRLSVLVPLLEVVPLASSQPQPQYHCNPAPGTEVGVALVGSVDHTLSESSPELCCYYASKYGGKGWTFETHGGDTCPQQTVLKGIAFNIGGSGSHSVSGNSSDDCCSLAVASGRSMWTYDDDAKTCTVFYEVRGRRHDGASTSGMGRIPGVDTCVSQTVLDGVAFDMTSGISSVKTNSSGDCCAKAQSEQRSLWSFNNRTNDCAVFYEMRGRHLDSDVTSGMGGTPGVGTCTIFSAITGTRADPRSMSARLDVAVVNFVV